MKKLIAFLILTALAFPLFSCGGANGTMSDEISDKSGVSEAGSEQEFSMIPEKTDLSANTFYNYNNINSCAVYGDDGSELTDGDEESVNVVVSDIANTFGDWYGKTHTTSLFEGKESYFYIEDDFGFPEKIDDSSIAFDPSSNLPDRVELYYSNDGYNYSFYAGEMNGNGGVYKFEFASPILAKSVKYVIYSAVGKKVSPVALHNNGVPTAERIVLSKDLSYTVEGQTPDTFKKYADNGTVLTDGKTGGETLIEGGYVALKSNVKDKLMNRDVIHIKLDLGTVKNVSEVYLNTAAASSVSIVEPDFISVKYSADGVSYSDFSMSFNMGSINGRGLVKNTYKAMRNYTIEARYLQINIYSSGIVMLGELIVYGSETPVAEPVYEFQEIDSYQNTPIIRGGFYGFFIDYVEGYNCHHYFDEYRTYIQLKGFRELGMDTVIVSGENLDYVNKLTLIEPPEELAAKGYRKGAGHGVYDLNETMLNAADKLGMSIYLSTAKSLAYSELKGSTADKQVFINSVLEDAEIMIRCLYDKYKDHKSFCGFYLVDETCDYWLMQEKQAKTSLTRQLYKGQSDVIRELDENLKIAIAPAAWRNDSPAGFGENLYTLIKNDTESGRPIMDYVFVQDCLGRFDTIKVPEDMYGIYDGYLQACKEGVEKAGAVFGNDAEIFDVGYRIKRFDEIKRSLALETPYTDYTIVFDLSHYFCANGRGDINKYAFSDNDYVCLQYVKYLNS